jgi:hypothetical protein
VRTDPRHVVQVGATVHLRVPERALHVFDLETELRVD